MALKFLNKAPLKPQPIPSPRVLNDSKQDDAEVKQQIRMVNAEAAATSELIEGPSPETKPPEENLTGDRKLSRLIEEDFPFDESQRAAINGVVRALTEEGAQISCMTGAAGTGKTTCTKAIVDELLDAGLAGQVDLDSYWKSDEVESDGDEEYVAPERFVPAICMVGFTGRSTQMIKKNFPRDWHGNIMTIHRMLAYMPEFYEDYDEETGDIKNKMRFIPTYNANFKLPWDYILIDEAGMTGTDLWENIRLAMKDTCKVIMIGDINQLPPVHGRSIFGFAMSEYPAYELTHIHRQEGKNNPIVDNAWRILKGERPESGGAFQMIKFDGNAMVASKQVRKLLPTLQEKGIYDPIRDTTITPINGEDGARGFALGQLPLNREFAIIFNDTEERYIIDAGRERKQFAVGDKLMATRNDHEVGITNGMTGVVTSIVPNGSYSGDLNRFGRVKDVNAWLAETGADDDDDEVISLDDLNESLDAIHDGIRRQKEDRERGPASHIVTVRFGQGDTAFEIPFASRAEVASLMTAYVVTCHKMQGGESPIVVIICHSTHKQMLSREWLYTAVTRASQKCILLYTDDALRIALSKQRIVGNTLAQKVKVFKDLSAKGILGSRVNVNLKWGESRSLTTTGPKEIQEFDADRQMAEASEGIKEEDIRRAERLEEEAEAAREKAARAERLHAEALAKLIDSMARILSQRAQPEPPEPRVVDGGDLKPFSDEWYEAKLNQVDNRMEQVKQLSGNQFRLESHSELKLLTYQPQAELAGWPAEFSEIESESKPQPKVGGLKFLRKGA